MTTGLESSSGAVPLPEGAGTARLVVCERTGSWAVGLRRETSAFGLRVYETRSVADCWEMLAGHPASFVVAELTPASAKGLLARMARLERDFPLARVAVVADRRLGLCEWLMREAGAVHFTCSPRQLRLTAQLAKRHLDHVPRPGLSVTERIWAGLPWSRGD